MLLAMSVAIAGYGCRSRDIERSHCRFGGKIRIQAVPRPELSLMLIGAGRRIDVKSTRLWASS